MMTPCVGHDSYEIPAINDTTTPLRASHVSNPTPYYQVDESPIIDEKQQPLDIPVRHKRDDH